MKWFWLNDQEFESLTDLNSFYHGKDLEEEEDSDAEFQLPECFSPAAGNSENSIHNRCVMSIAVPCATKKPL